MANAADLKSAGRKTLWVRSPPPVPLFSVEWPCQVQDRRLIGEAQSTLRSFIRARRDGLSANTVRIRFAGLRAFFAWAERVGEVGPSPMTGLKSSRPVEVLKPTYSVADVQVMLDSFRDDFTGRRDKAAIMVLFDCGLKASEMLAPWPLASPPPSVAETPPVSRA